MIKNSLQKVGIKGAYLNIIKVIYDNPITNIILNSKKLKSISSKIRSKTRMPTLATFTQHSFGSPSRGHKIRKRKGIQIGKEVAKLSLFADDVILYIENPKDTTRKLLDLINEFVKVAGYKINIQKSVAFLYTNNEISQREIKETIPFITASKRI